MGDNNTLINALRDTTRIRGQQLRFFFESKQVNIISRASYGVPLEKIASNWSVLDKRPSYLFQKYSLLWIAISVFMQFATL